MFHKDVDGFPSFSIPFLHLFNVFNWFAASVRYFRKVKKLFQTIDSSGDGAICFEEFAKLVTSPKLQFWMSQLAPCT